MRGIQQESKRIPHHYTTGSTTAEGVWHRVTLRPDDEDEVPCGRAPTLIGAYDNAAIAIKRLFPGASL